MRSRIYSKTFFALPVLLLNLDSAPLLAQHDFGGMIAKSARDHFRRSLVTVHFSYQVSGVMYQDRYIPDIRVEDNAETQGVVIDSRGHVAALAGDLFAYEKSLGGLKVSLRTSDGKLVPARIIGVDQRIDLVLLRSERLSDRALPTASHPGAGQLYFVFRSDDDWRVASFHAQAIRSKRALPVEELHLKSVYDMHYKALPGSFVLNPHGELAGVVVSGQKYYPDTRSASFFVLPYNVLRESIDEMIERGGSISSGWLGVRLEFNRPSGIITVADVWPNNPAEAAGVRKGDRILEIDGLKLDAIRDLGMAIRWKGADAVVRLKILRNDAIRNLKAVLSHPPEESVWAIHVPESWDPKKAQDVPLRLYKSPLSLPVNLGVNLSPLQADWAQKLKVPVQKGLMVWTIIERTPAEKVFEVGDVIYRVNGVQTCCMDELTQVLRKAKGRPIFIEFYRDGLLKTIEVHLQ